MKHMHTFSSEAMARPFLAMQVADVLRENAPAIASVAAATEDNAIVLAMVRKDLFFEGVAAIAREDLIDRVNQREQTGGWTLTFGANVTIAEIEERCVKWSRLAARRGELLQQRAQRQNGEL